MLNLFKRLLNRKSWLIPLLLAIVYAIISGVNLAQISGNPSATWIGNYESKNITFIFDKPTKLSRVYYFLGLSNGKFKVSAQLESGIDSPIVEIDTSGKQPPVYQWSSIAFKQNLKINRLTFSTESPTIEFKQLAIFDNKNNLVKNYKISIGYDNTSDSIKTLFATLSPPKNYDPSIKSSIVFDELYYVITAYQYIHHLPLFANTHPPLGTLIIALGILIFGMKPLGWRIMAYLCGIIMVPLIYYFAKKVFKSNRAAIFAALLLMFDFMHFTINRYALIDSMVTLFICAEYLMLFCYIENQKLAKLNSAQNNLWGIALFFALALATKWIALFSLLAILPIIIYYEFFYKKPQFKHQLAVSDNVQNAIRKSNIRSTLKLAYLSIFVIILYSMSFIPQYATQTESQNFISFIIQQHLAMWHYHTTYAVTHHHQFESPWWSWFLMLRPQRIYSWMNYTTKEYSSIVLMGNPAIWWFSIVAILIMMINFVKTRSWQLGFILLAIASQYLPYMLLKRTSFIYYLYSVTPFMILAITWALDAALKRSEKSLKRLVCIYLILVIGLFILFYPAISGLEIHRDYTYRYLLWYQSWDF
ncbi:MAG: phospholipid carrier-dependent glycosyltransferase [Burkholderiales bacterium]|nr:phospholipid carrier-dependent glycosyltransferase [Burkholderiales bacterium]